MKKIISIALTILLIFTVTACSSGGSNSDDPNLGVWKATTGEMMGLSMGVEDFFEEGFTIELKTNGKCALEVDGEKANGSWTLENGAFTVKGGGLDCKGRLENGTLTLDDVMGLGLNLVFEKEGGDKPSGSDTSNNTPTPAPLDNQENNSEVPSASTGLLTTVDMGLFTVEYPDSLELEDDWLQGKMLKDKEGRYEFIFTNLASAADIQYKHDEMLTYGEDEYVNDYEEFTQTIGGMTDVFAIKYNSVVYNEAIYLITFPSPIDDRAGVQIRFSARDNQYQIDTILELPEVQAILDSIEFK